MACETPPKHVLRGYKGPVLRTRVLGVGKEMPPIACVPLIVRLNDRVQDVTIQPMRNVQGPYVSNVVAWSKCETPGLQGRCRGAAH